MIAFAAREWYEQRLMARASRRVAWHWLETHVAGIPWKIATASDPDGMLLDACRRQDAGEVGVIDPFWATTWRAADGLDQFLETRDLRGVRVLELGCGTGRAGLAAALRGSQVTLTDGVSDPLLLVKLTTMPVRERCDVRRLRFAEDRLNQPRYPVILGSDITYSRDLWPKLDVCLRQHLADGGEVLLSDPYRSISTEFAGWIQRRTWTYEEHRMILSDDQTRPIRVMRLRLVLNDATRRVARH
jgi:predicted nicotinamide N-methyase